ncbi:MAG: hypothetical protein WCI65_00760 [Synechococcaceae cyanobacterium ELA263]
MSPSELAVFHSRRERKRAAVRPIATGFGRSLWKTIFPLDGGAQAASARGTPDPDGLDSR